MLMSAGLGTRLRPFTNLVAKPILPLLGVPMAQFALDAMNAANVEKVVANVHHLADHTASALKFLERPKKIEISNESRTLLGSAGGLANALPLFDNQPFFLMNADTVASIPLLDLMRTHQKLRHQYGVKFTLAILQRSPAVGKYREIFLDHQRGLIRGASETTASRVPFFMGVAVIEPDALTGIDPYSPSEFAEKMLFPTIAEGKAGYYLVDNTLLPGQQVWFDIGDAKLWHQTHLDLMRLWEEEELPGLWRRRLDRAIKKIAPGIFVAKNCALTEAPPTWKGPCFWSPDLGETTPPDVLTPGSILYGKLPATHTGGPGIGFRGLWQPVS